MDGTPHRSSEDVLDLEGIDYEEDSEAEKVTLMHEGKRKASYSRQDKSPAGHDRLLGGNLPSRKADRPAEEKISGAGKVEQGEGREPCDNCDMQKGGDSNQEGRLERGQRGSQRNGLVTNCRCQDENEDCSHAHCDNSQEMNGSVSDCNDSDNRCYGDTNKEVDFECSTCPDNHNSCGHVLGCVNDSRRDACESEKSKNNNLAPRDISLASESATDWEPVETGCNHGNDGPPLISNMVLIDTDCHGNHL